MVSLRSLKPVRLRNVAYVFKMAKTAMTSGSPFLEAFTLPLIVLIALLLRGYFLYLTRDIKPVMDEVSYLRMAREVAATGSFGALWRWPPGQPYFIAAIIRIAGEKIVVIKAVEVALSSLSVILIHRIAEHTFGSRYVGTLAATLACIYPTFIAFSHYLWSETLFIFLYLLFIHLLFESPKSWRPHRLVLCGALFGLACLTRSIAMVSVPAVVVYLWLKSDHSRKILAHLLIFLAGFAATMAPWTIRNFKVHGGWVLVAPNLCMNLWRGNSLLPGSPKGSYDFSREKYEASGETALERERYAFQMAMDLIRMSQPHWLLKKFLIHLHNWRASSPFVLRHLRMGFYGDVGEPTQRLLSIFVQAIYGFVIIAAILGLAWTRHNLESRFLITVAALFTLTFVVTIATNSRLRVSIMPIILMFSATGLVKVYEFVTQTLSRAKPGKRTPAGFHKPHERATLWQIRLLLCVTGIALFTFVSLSNVVRLARILFKWH